MKEHQGNKLGKWIVGLVILLIVLIAGYSYTKWHALTSSVVVNDNDASKEIKGGKPFSVLVMGTDVGALGRGTSYAGNTDTMELITVNPKQKRVLMVAIPRDTLVKVNTEKGADYVKINAAYAIGGAKQAEKQVAELLDVPVNYYALTNMGTLEKVVDAVGGVSVNNPFAFTYEGYHFKKGWQHLNGSNALKYSRMRYDDPNNDYGRQKRGQQVIQSVIESFKKHGSIEVANKIITATKDGVRTNVPLNNLASLYLHYHQALSSTKKDHLQGKDATIEGVSFQIASPSEINRVSKEVRTSLDLPAKSKVVNNETKLYNLQTTWDSYQNTEFVLPNGAHYNQPGK